MRLSWQDSLAGVSVAVVVIPQSIAYAGIAGLSPTHGLYAAALPSLAAALFASSPYLQTGPAVSRLCSRSARSRPTRRHTPRPTARSRFSSQSESGWYAF